MLHHSRQMPGDVIRPEVVMITGASAGVGRAVAQAFGSRGASVGLFARGRAGLEAAARDVAAAGGRALILKGDVADSDRVEEAAAALEQTFGPIDIWINNAMTSVFSPVIEMEPAEYKRVTDVTYLGMVHGTLAALRRMKPRNRGVIIQVGSALAYRAVSTSWAFRPSRRLSVTAPPPAGRIATSRVTDTMRSKHLNRKIRSAHTTCGRP